MPDRDDVPTMHAVATTSMNRLLLHCVNGDEARSTRRTKPYAPTPGPMALEGRRGRPCRVVVRDVGLAAVEVTLVERPVGEPARCEHRSETELAEPVGDVGRSTTAPWRHRVVHVHGHARPSEVRAEEPAERLGYANARDELRSGHGRATDRDRRFAQMRPATTIEEIGRRHWPPNCAVSDAPTTVARDHWPVAACRTRDARYGDEWRDGARSRSVPSA